MVSETLIIILLILFVLIISVVIYFLIRRNNNSNGGTTGSTGSSCTACTVVSNGCSSAGVLTIGYTGSNCNATCKQTVTTTPVVGCVGPQCGSIYCTPQQALYTNLNSTNTLVNFCSSGANTSYPSNTCNVSLTGQQLGSLIVPGSSVINQNLQPVFITTTYLSIYQTTQPTTVGTIPQESIAINLTDSSVIDNPYVLYNYNGVVSFQRINNIIALNDINNAIWAYNTDTQRLVLFSNINQNYSLNSTLLEYIKSYFGYNNLNGTDYPNTPCGIMNYSSPSVGTNVYDSNSGLFSVTQTNNSEQNMSGQFVVTTDSNNNYLATSTCPNISINEQYQSCNNYNYARWYGISAINIFLGN
jgi:hypothetical protein